MRHTATGSHHTSVLASFVGFVPWVAFWILNGFGELRIACALALALVVLLNVPSMVERRLKTFDLASLGFFAVGFVAALANVPVFDAHANLFGNVVLAGVAWATLFARSPFTEQYAREEVSPEIARSAAFRHINVVLTATWGAAFTLSAFLSLIAMRWPSGTIWTKGVVANLATLAAVVVTLKYPRYYAGRMTASAPTSA